MGITFDLRHEEAKVAFTADGPMESQTSLPIYPTRTVAVNDTVKEGIAPSAINS